MDLSYVRLIGERREELWTGQKDFTLVFDQSGAPLGPLDHLAFIKEKRGEKIVAVDNETGGIAGWVGLYPDRDKLGAFLHLAGIEVRADHRCEGIGTRLMTEARGYALERGITRLKFATSPLLTANAALYITRFGTRYRWKEGVRLPDGRPWPYVSCECDFDDPLTKPEDPPRNEIASRSVLAWDGTRPVPRAGLVFSGPLTVLLPRFTNSSLRRAVDATPGFLMIVYGAFERLFLHGYHFAWFDRLRDEEATPAPVDGASCYYVMKRHFAL